MRAFILALALVAPLAYAAPACKIEGLPKIVGMDYHDARVKLIRAGFRPLLNQCDHDFERHEKSWGDIGYTEITTCSGGGVSYCLSEWKTNKGRAFTISTKFGEVTNYFTCPADAPRR